MIVLGYADLLAVAARVLACRPTILVDRTDLESVGLTLEEVRAAAGSDGVAVAAGTLLHGLVRRRPFPRANRRIAVAATLQMLALNDWDLDLDLAVELNRLLDDAARGAVSAPRLADLLRTMLRPLAPREAASETEAASEEATVFEKFSDHARHTLVLAQDEARLLNHTHVGTEHVLLGLVLQRAGHAGRVLDDLGVTVDAAREQIRELVGQGVRQPSGHVPFTPRAKRVLELAACEAPQLGHDYIDTEHILLGIIREGKGIGAQVLVKLGLDLNDVRQRVIAVAAAHPGEQRSPVAETSAGARRHRLMSELTAVLDENDKLRRRIEILKAQLHRHGIEPEGPPVPGAG
jgi:prophage maintenance system killer protein